MELTAFNDFDTHITEQTNKLTQLVSAFKIPKGDTKVWTIATATLPRDVKTSKQVSKHQVEHAKLLTHVIRCITPISIYEIVLTYFLSCGLVLFSDIYF